MKPGWSVKPTVHGYVFFRKWYFCRSLHGGLRPHWFLVKLLGYLEKRLSPPARLSFTRETCQFRQFMVLNLELVLTGFDSNLREEEKHSEIRLSIGPRACNPSSELEAGVSSGPSWAA